MQVYRIENENGQGPWNGGANGISAYCNSFDTEAYPYPGVHPSPSDERNTRMGEVARFGWPQELFFGCKDLDQVRFWFGCERGRAAMAAKGYRLAVYEVPDDDVVAGNVQLAFPKHIARPVESRCLVTLN